MKIKNHGNSSSQIVSLPVPSPSALPPRSDFEKGVVQGANETEMFVDLFTNKVVLISALVASIGGLLFGYDIGVIAGIIKPLKKEYGYSEFQESLIVSTLLLGAFFGSLCGGFIIDHFGRRRTILILSVIFIVGSLCLAASPNFATLVIGRLTIGFAVSISAVADCIYISEISTPQWRGFLVTLNEVAIAGGILLAYIANAIFHKVTHGWRYMFLVPFFFAAAQGSFVYFLPNSPRWLLMKGRSKEAEQTLLRIRGEDCNKTELSNEFDEMLAAIGTEKETPFIQYFRDHKSFRYQLFVGMLVVGLQQISGMSCILYFAPIILEDAGFGSSSNDTGVIFIGIVKFISTIIAILLVDKLGRRPLLLGGSIIITISCLLLGIILSTQYQSTAKQVFTLILIGLFSFGYAVGYGPVSWVLLSEIFPLAVRGRSFSFTSCLNWIMSFALSFAFLPVLDHLGLNAVLFIFFSLNFFGIIMIGLFVPETKGKTLEEITVIMSKPPDFSWKKIFDNLFSCLWSTDNHPRSVNSYELVDSRRFSAEDEEMSFLDDVDSDELNPFSSTEDL